MTPRADLTYPTGYRSLAPIYFRNSAAAVIVYDITQVSLMNRLSEQVRG